MVQNNRYTHKFSTARNPRILDAIFPQITKPNYHNHSRSLEVIKDQKSKIFNIGQMGHQFDLFCTSTHRLYFDLNFTKGRSTEKIELMRTRSNDLPNGRKFHRKMKFRNIRYRVLFFPKPKNRFHSYIMTPYQNPKKTASLYVFIVSG